MGIYGAADRQVRTGEGSKSQREAGLPERLAIPCGPTKAPYENCIRSMVLAHSRIAGRPGSRLKLRAAFKRAGVTH